MKNTVACFRKKGWDSLSTLEELTKKLSSSSISNSSSQGNSSSSGPAASASSGSYCVKCNKGGAVSTRSKGEGAARDVEIENVGRHLNNSADKLSGTESPKRKGKMETGFAEKGPITRTSKRPRALDQNQEGAVIDQQIAKRSKP